MKLKPFDTRFVRPRSGSLSGGGAKRFPYGAWAAGPQQTPREISYSTLSVSPASSVFAFPTLYWINNDGTYDRALVFTTSGGNAGCRILTYDGTTIASGTSRTIDASNIIVSILRHPVLKTRFLVLCANGTVYVVDAPASGTGQATVTTAITGVNVSGQAGVSGIGNCRMAWVNTSGTAFVICNADSTTAYAVLYTLLDTTATFITQATDSLVVGTGTNRAACCFDHAGNIGYYSCQNISPLNEGAFFVQATTSTVSIVTTQAFSSSAAFYPMPVPNSLAIAGVVTSGSHGGQLVKFSSAGIARITQETIVTAVTGRRGVYAMDGVYPIASFMLDTKGLLFPGPYGSFAAQYADSTINSSLNGDFSSAFNEDNYSILWLSDAGNKIYVLESSAY